MEEEVNPPIRPPIPRRAKSSSRRAVLAALVLLLLATALSWGQAPTCPKCGAPIEAGAAFCAQCGAKLEGVAPAASAVPQPKDALIQVVAIHDREASSVYEAMANSATVRVDSLLGSGFSLGGGEFLTDASLLMGAREIRIRDAKGRTGPARLVALDPLIGVALLSADLKDVPALARRQEGAMREGEELLALGYTSASGMAPVPTSTPGVVSGLHRSGFGIHPVEDYLQSDASLPRGFAGGPGVDSQGRLVGMCTAMQFGQDLLQTMTGIGLLIPAEWLDRSLAWMRSGSPPRAWIGAHVEPADSDSRKLFSLGPEVRWVVEDVFPESPAQAAGLRRGDGLLKLQGEVPGTLAVVQSKLLQAKAGERWVAEVQREGKSVPLEVVLAQRPDRPRLTGRDALRLYGGFEIQAESDSRLVISRVHAGSEASGSKLKPGDALTSFFTKKDLSHVERSDARWRSVKDMADLEEQIQRAYSDLDFFLGLKFRCKDGEKRMLFLYEMLTATKAL
jgi:S1-C subfamily serine protease